MPIITKVPENISGLPDSFEMETQCGITKFSTDKQGQKNGIRGLEVNDCKILWSAMSGVFSISIKDKDVMLTLKYEDLLDIIQHDVERRMAQLEIISNMEE